MCTLIALHRRVPGAPLVVAANRDEYLDRPTRGPALRDTPRGAVVAPLDERAGGTWLGVNAHGVFAAVTNRPCAAPDPARRSRGLLVLDVLAAERAAQAAGQLSALEAQAYNPFNLYVADADAAFAITYADKPEPVALAGGVHVIGNADPNAPPSVKLARLLDRAARAAETPAPQVLDALAALCRTHEGVGSPLFDVCVHTQAFGTRSSTLLRLGETLAESALLHADGAPCQATYRDLSPLLRQLGRASQAEEHNATRTSS